jgi:hypothetical protein
MTTALELINDALREIGIKDDANALEPEQSAHALRMLNRLLGRWASRRLLLPVLSDVSVTLDGSASYTIGPTGADVTTARPLRIEAARLVLNATEYPVRVLNQQERNAIADKTLTGIPAAVWYEATPTNGVLHVYPIGSNGTLKLNVRAVLVSVTGLDQVLTLPEGYEDALVPALADACASSYQIKTPVDVLRRAAAGMAAIKAANSEPLYLTVGLESAGNFDIQRGY